MGAVFFCEEAGRLEDWKVVELYPYNVSVRPDMSCYITKKYLLQVLREKLFQSLDRVFRDLCKDLGELLKRFDIVKFPSGRETIYDGRSFRRFTGAYKQIIFPKDRGLNEFSIRLLSISYFSWSR